jgi:hypothetical protein
VSYADAIPARLTIKRSSLSSVLFVMVVSVLVFIRFLNAETPFSYDYETYLRIIDSLSYLTFAELFGDNLILPYVVSYGAVPVEVGFAFVVKCISLVTSIPEVSYALMATASLVVRISAMMLLRVPRLWILWINIFPIILFESNALRLGMAASILLLSLQRILTGNRVIGVSLLVLSLTFHLQLVFFVLPFTVFYFLYPWITRNKFYVIFALFIFTVAAVVGSNYLALLPSEKISVYVARGSTASAGLSITSSLSILLLVSSASLIHMNPRLHEGAKPFAAILAACFPSLVLFVFVTNISAIGDRAWQLAFMIFSAFFFSNWTTRKRRKIPFLIFVLLTSALVINSIYRYPLADFFSPPFPPIDFIGLY